MAPNFLLKQRALAEEKRFSSEQRHSRTREFKSLGEVASKPRNPHENGFR